MSSASERGQDGRDRDAQSTRHAGAAAGGGRSRRWEPRATAGQRMHLAAETAGGDQHEPLAALGELIGELHRDAAAEGARPRSRARCRARSAGRACRSRNRRPSSRRAACRTRHARASPARSPCTRASALESARATYRERSGAIAVQEKQRRPSARDQRTRGGARGWSRSCTAVLAHRQRRSPVAVLPDSTRRTRRT